MNKPVDMTTQTRPKRRSPQPRKASYVPNGVVWDEMKSSNGHLRGHWRGFMDQYQALSATDMERRWDLAQSLLRDNGVTYNLHGDTAGLDRPWRLDPLPLIISAQEWSGLAKGIAQRAKVINAVLGDLYGDRTLIAKGVVPAALLHANPGFLRPCHGWPRSRSNEKPFQHLTVYAADMIRGPDGAWHVYADRTESPAGAGYALENRTVVGRTLSEILRTIHVERLAPFFDALKSSLRAASPRRSDEPRVVLLTPGPYNETYFEHAYLARQLGITLVQGEDLTARDNHIYLKTLTGLQQVDVIFRHMSGEWCDPLDLRGDSMLGVAGLVQAARAGNVALVNALGSGLLDGGAFTAIMPQAAQLLIGEELLLPTIKTWWCGNGNDREHVLANLEGMSLRPAFRGTPRAVLPASLSKAELEKTRLAIATRPWEWMAQLPEQFSTVPVWQHGTLSPSSMMVRVFAVATPDNQWHVMAGGLVRVADQPNLLAVGRLQSGGGGSKDLWVLARDEHSASVIDTRIRKPPVKLVRGNRDLPSRVADNMFWLGRYLERSDAKIRLLRSALLGLEDALDQGEVRVARRHVNTLTRLGLAVPKGALEEAPSRLPRALIEFHLTRQEESLALQVERLTRVAANLRDRLSIDTWRIIQHLRDQIETSRPKSRPMREDMVGWLNNLILIIEAANGLSMENMTRGPLWQFLDSGRRIERAIFILDMVAGALTDNETEEAVPMDLLLDIADSVMTYRSRYLAAPRLAGVLDLLLCDESNPRSLGFQLSALSDHMNSLATQNFDGFFRPEQKMMTVLCGIVRTMDVAILADPIHDAGFHDAERLLESLRSRMWEISEVISREYLTHAQWRLPTQPSDYLL